MLRQCFLRRHLVPNGDSHAAVAHVTRPYVIVGSVDHAQAFCERLERWYKLNLFKKLHKIQTYPARPWDPG